MLNTLIGRQAPLHSAELRNLSTFANMQSSDAFIVHFPCPFFFFLLQGDGGFSAKRMSVLSVLCFAGFFSRRFSRLEGATFLGFQTRLAAGACVLRLPRCLWSQFRRLGEDFSKARGAGLTVASKLVPSRPGGSVQTRGAEAGRPNQNHRASLQSLLPQS